MKLLVQGDDYGFTKGVTYGILDAIDNGVLRNTGLFANMPFIDYRPAVKCQRDHRHASALTSTWYQGRQSVIRRKYLIW